MIIAYYVFETATNNKISAYFEPATFKDLQTTQIEHWQTNWLSTEMQSQQYEKYALKTKETDDLIGLGAYSNMPEGICVYIQYIETAAHSNPTLTTDRKYTGIGAALLAFGIQLSIDYGYGGTVFLKAKTDAIRNHYINDFGAVPFSRADPFLLMIDGDAALNLLSVYFKEETSDVEE